MNLGVLLLVVAQAVSSGAMDADFTPDYTDLVIELQAAMENMEGTYGIDFRDLESGVGATIRARDPFFAASTIKLPVVLYVTEQIIAGQAKWSDTVTYLPADYEGIGVVHFSPFGTRFTLRDLVHYCVRYSCNDGVNMLIRWSGKETLQEYWRGLGANVVLDKENLSSAHSMSQYLERLIQIAEESEDGKWLLGQFMNTLPGDRIPALLPDDVDVAHKIGNWPGSLNDVGIVYHKERPFILSVLSADVPDYGTGVNQVAKLAKIVYDYQDRMTQAADEWQRARGMMVQGDAKKAG